MLSSAPWTASQRGGIPIGERVFSASGHGKGKAHSAPRCTNYLNRANETFRHEEAMTHWTGLLVVVLWCVLLVHFASVRVQASLPEILPEPREKVGLLQTSLYYAV